MQVEGMRELPAPPSRVRLFSEADLHCTLAFLGSVDAEAAKRSWLHTVALADAAPVRGGFTGVRPLGSPRKPSALSAIVGEGEAALSAMTMEVRATCLEAAGAPEDTRPPLPHMTLARIQRRASGAERREAIRWAEGIDLESARFTVSAVALYTWSEDRQTRLFQIVEARSLDAA